MREDKVTGHSLANLMSRALDAMTIAPFPVVNTFKGKPGRGYRIVNRLNRSRRWPFARTYQEARNMSPSTEPVR